MGPYHIARMNAIAEIVGSSNLTVIEICPKDDHDWDISKYEKKFNYQCILKNETLDKFSLNKAIKPLRAWFADNQTDIVINACGYFHLGLRQILKTTKKKLNLLILWSETTEIDNPNPWYKKRIKKFMTSIYDGAIVAGNRHKVFLQSIGFIDVRIEVVGNVVNNAIFKPEFELNNRNNSILFVGRLLKIKNVTTLINAFSLIKKQFPDWKLKIVGSGPEQTRIEQQILNLKLDSSVELLGLRQPDELIQLYRSEGIFVLPSYSEPWGLVVNEAMASGMPCVLSHQCGSSEMIENYKSAVLFDATKIEELADSLKIVMDNQQLRTALSKEGYKVVSGFTPETYAKLVTAFLIRLQNES
jgi:glycosyltransferase involved in cell wall biosynthesis